jgi:hypothetical protein
MPSKFKDPNPLPVKGTPSQRIGGMRFKSPNVDAENMVLPNAEKKENSKLLIENPNEISFDPNGFDPMKSSGNSKYTDPKTGEIKMTKQYKQSTENSTNTTELKIISPSLTESTVKLNELKKSQPVPKSNIPVGPRVVTKNLKTSNVNVDTTDEIRNYTFELYK